MSFCDGLLKLQDRLDQAWLADRVENNSVLRHVLLVCCDDHPII